MTVLFKPQGCQPHQQHLCFPGYASLIKPNLGGGGSRNMKKKQGKNIKTSCKDKIMKGRTREITRNLYTMQRSEHEEKKTKISINTTLSSTHS